jgi:hypothetical protein
MKKIMANIQIFIDVAFVEKTGKMFGVACVMIVVQIAIEKLSHIIA